MKLVVLRSKQSVELVACQNGIMSVRGCPQWRYAVRAESKLTTFTSDHSLALLWYNAIASMQPLETLLRLSVA